MANANVEDPHGIEVIYRIVASLLAVFAGYWLFKALVGGMLQLFYDLFIGHKK